MTWRAAVSRRDVLAAMMGACPLRQAFSCMKNYLRVGPGCVSPGFGLSRRRPQENVITFEC